MGHSSWAPSSVIPLTDSGSSMLRAISPCSSSVQTADHRGGELIIDSPPHAARAPDGVSSFQAETGHGRSEGKGPGESPMSAGEAKSADPRVRARPSEPRSEDGCTQEDRMMASRKDAGHRGTRPR